MTNLLRMDCRRLVKSRSFYIVLGVQAAIIFLATLLAAMDRQISEEIRSMTQLEFVDECIGSGALLIMVGLGVTLFVHGDFSSGFIKNICFVRPRRREYVLSKLLTAGAYSGLITAVGILAALICPLLFGLRPAASPLLRILEYALWYWLPNWAFSLMGLALVTITRSTVLGITLTVLAGGGATAQLLGLLCQAMRWPPLEQYLLSSVARTQCVPGPGPQQITMILACTAGWSAVYLIGSLLTMEKRDI